MKTKVKNYLNNKYITYYIKSIAEDGKTIIVDTDQDIFDGIDEKDYSKIVKMYIQDYLIGNYESSTKEKMTISAKTANKFSNPGKFQRNFNEKMKLSPEFSNILKIIKNRKSSVPNKKNSKFPHWEYYNFNFKIENKIFEATLNIGIDKNGNKIAYDINKIKKVDRLYHYFPTKKTTNNAVTKLIDANISKLSTSKNNTLLQTLTVNDQIAEYRTSTRILDLPENERPRERLINHGAENLSNEELLAIIIRTGTKNESAKVLASNILKILSNIQDFNDLNYESLIKIKGIGQAKACDLLTVIELGKRLNQKYTIIKNIKCTNPKTIFEYYNEKMKNLKQEHFYTVYLDINKRIIKEKLLFVGTINQSLVDPANIFKEAFIINAKAIICIHNHPSDILHPSKADIDLTNKIKKIGNTLNIILIDHIIIGLNNYYSFLENHDL